MGAVARRGVFNLTTPMMNPMIEQPNSALARADRLLSETIANLNRSQSAKGSLESEISRLIQSSGALGFAGNSQSKLIKACADQVKYYAEVCTKRRLSFAEQALLDGHKAAIEHASGPGID